MTRIEYPLLPPLEGEYMPVSGRCPYCHRHTIWKDLFVRDPQQHQPQGLKNGRIEVNQCGHPDCSGLVYREVNPSRYSEEWDIYPAVELQAEDELKDPVKRSYQEALNVFGNGHWTPTVQALGRTLMDATAMLRPTSITEKDWLAKKAYVRIEELGKTGTIPDSMKQWLLEIRTSRVWAEHGDEYKDWWATEPEAIEALEFTKWFLRFAFILPEQLQKRKARLAALAKKP